MTINYEFPGKREGDEIDFEYEVGSSNIAEFFKSQDDETVMSAAKWSFEHMNEDDKTSLINNLIEQDGIEDGWVIKGQDGKYILNIPKIWQEDKEYLWSELLEEELYEYFEDEIKEYFYDDAKDVFDDQQLYDSDPLGYYGMSLRDFI